MFRRTLALCFAVLSLTASLVHATPTNLWAHRYTGSSDKGFNELTIDRFGNLVGVGYFYDTVTFDQLFTTAGGRDVFFVKFDANGNVLWSRQVGTTSGDDGYDVTTDVASNVIGVGQIGSSPTDGAAMLVKYGPDGTQRFLKEYGVADDTLQTIQYVSTDLSKNIIMAGEFLGTIDLGGGPLHDSGGPTVFLAKLDQTGHHIWSKRFPGTTEFIQSLAGLETSSDGQTTLFGTLDGTINFGTGPLTTAGGTDMFLVRFDANGNVVWAHKYGAAGDQFPSNIAINESGQIAMAGFASSPFTLGGGTLTPAGDWDPFVGVFTPGGAHVWSKLFAGAGTQFSQDVTWASNQDVLLTCRGYGTLDFGGGPLTNPGTNFNLYCARFFGANGSHRWSRTYTATADVGALVEEDHGQIILAGPVAGDVNFGSGLLPGTAADDAFVAKFADNLTGVSSPLLRTTLEQNVPNPFNPVTTIGYTLNAPMRAVIAIYDASGAVVTRIDAGMQPVGSHSVTWNGLDRSGRRVASGVYFYRLEGMPATGTRKMILLK